MHGRIYHSEHEVCSLVLSQLEHIQCHGAISLSTSRTFSSRWNAAPFKQWLSILLCLQPLITIVIFSVYECDRWIPHRSGIMRCMSFQDWLISLSRTSSGLIYVIVCFRILSLGECQCSYSLLGTHVFMYESGSDSPLLIPCSSAPC